MKVVAPTQIREPQDLKFLSTAHHAQDSLEIDLADVEWISPLGVVAVLATCLRADESSLEATVHLPENRSARTYLVTIGLLDELTLHGWALTSDGLLDQQLAEAGRLGWSRHGDIDIEAFAATSFIPQGGPSIQGTVDDIDIDPDMRIGPHLSVSRLTTVREVDVAADRLEDALRQAPHIRGGLFDELMTVAVELTANAREHGSACYAVAQTYTGRKSGTPGVRLAVADFGEGLARSLRKHYGYMTDGEAIVRAFEERVSGTGRSERGFGLTQVAEIVDRGTERRPACHLALGPRRAVGGPVSGQRERDPALQGDSGIRLPPPQLPIIRTAEVLG